MVLIHKKHKETNEEKDARLKKEQEQALGVQDEYQARGFELVSWVQDHKAIVSALILLLFIGGGAFSAFIYYKDRKSEAASGAFLEALKSLESDAESADKKKQAQDELSKLAKDFQSSGVAHLANLYAAHLALENGDAENSVKLYQEVLKGIDKSDPIYTSAIIGLSYAQEKSGDQKSALSGFESVIALKDAPGVDLALWEAARLVKDQSAEKAKEYVSMLLEQYPQSVYEKNAVKLKESLQ